MLYVDTSRTHPTHVEPDLDRALFLMKHNDMGDLVGYQPIRNEDGSVRAYQLIGTNGLLEMDPLGNVYRATAIWGWSDPRWPAHK